MSLFTTQSTSASTTNPRAGSTSNTVVPSKPVSGVVNGGGVPQVEGVSLEIGGANTYVMNTNGVVLFFADVLADESNNYIINYLRRKGFLVIVFDYTGAPEVPAHSVPTKELRAQYEAWAGPHHERIKQLLPKWLDGVREKFDAFQYFFAIGSGFGAHFALEACMPTYPWILAGAVLHPDFNEISHFTSLDKPVLFTFTNTTDNLGREVRTWVETTLAGPKGTPKAKYAIQVFATDLPDVSTGRDPKIENEEYATQEFARSSSKWFGRAIALKTGPQ